MSLTKTQLEGVDGGVDTSEQMGKISLFIFQLI